MVGFKAVPDNMRSASKDISDATDGADELELDGVTGDDAEVFGHDGVAAAIGSFCSTWYLAVDLLRDNAESVGDILTDAADTYENREKESVVPGAAGEQEVA